MSRVPAASLTVALSVIAVLAVQTGLLFPVLATIVVAQILIASAPSPADARGRAIPTPQFLPTLVAGFLAATIAYRPGVLLGAAGTRAGIDGLVSTGVLAGVLPGVALGVLTAIVAEARRRDGRRELVRSLSTVVSLAAFAAVASAWIGAARASTGREIVTIACSGMVVALVVSVLPGSRLVVVCGALLAGAGAGIGAAHLVSGPASWPFAAVVGLAAGGFALVGLAVGMTWTAGRHHLAAGWGFPGALAFALTGPLVYIGGQLASAGL